MFVNFCLSVKGTDIVIVMVICRQFSFCCLHGHHDIHGLRLSVFIFTGMNVFPPLLKLFVIGAFITCFMSSMTIALYVSYVHYE